MDAETRDYVKRLSFRGDDITAMKFASSSIVVSGLRDGTIAVWEWESNATPVILSGHINRVNDIALSRDRTRIFPFPWTRQ